ncbi:MAG: hypothetical protein M1822_007317 [Bathelium mastoideum]|nr:MAG: hypothetical protein M1822_007317 [Bathelium mastoideum]
MSETHARALKRKYDELQSQQTIYEELYELVRSKPEKEALELYHRIRAGDDAESILKLVKEGDLLLQLALVPETRYRHQFPYVKEMPLFLQQPDNPYTASTIYEWTVGALSTSQQSPPSAERSEKRKEEESRFVKPFRAAVLVDPILDSVQPSKWTNVSTNDELMRELLRLYFLREHMWFTYLHKNLFLEDMASESEAFCSPLLVNAALAFACVSVSRKSRFLLIDF